MFEPRAKRLEVLFESVLKGERTAALTNPKLFLEAICEQTAAVTSISRLVASPQGLEMLLLALGCDTSLSFLNRQLTKFLKFISVPELQTVCGGTVLRQIVSKVMEVPLMWEHLVKAAQDQVLEQRALSAFAWLLIQLLSLPHEEAIKYLVEAQDPNIRRALMLSSEDIKAQGQRIGRITHTLIGSLTYEQRKDTELGPGGRHNNDFADFHKISIYPTKDELLLGTSDVYLPRASDVEQRAQGPHGLAYHIDRQFRLLREDMLCELREELAAAAQPKRRRKPLEINGLSLIGVHIDNRFSWSLRFICKYDLWQFRGLNPKKRMELLQDHPKFLKHGFLVCLFNKNNFLTFGTLVREEDLLVRVPSVLCIQIPATNIEKVLMQLKLAGPCIRLLQVDTAIFTYEPVLKQLQRVWKLSLAPEIVTWQPGTKVPPPTYDLRCTLEKLPDSHFHCFWRKLPVYDRRSTLEELPFYDSRCTLEELLEDLSKDYSCNIQSHLQLPKPTKLDKAQAECFLAALQQRVVLIQGPPGTGKSFIGSLVGKAIYECTDETILVVCFTHHALDDFLGHLLDLGIPDGDIVRLGSTRKATVRTSSLGLKEYRKDIKFTSRQWDIFDSRKKEVGEHARNLHNAFYQFVKFNPRTRNREDLLDFLKFSNDNLLYYNAFKLPEDKDGMTVVGKRGKKLDKFYLLDQWLSGQDAGTFKSQIPHQHRAVWRMTREEREQKYEQWYQEMIKVLLAQICRAGMLYNSRVEEVDAVYMEKDLSVLKDKRIIACTTTAAAKYSDAIRSVSPGVVLVEEAGEILESHVLTALGPKTKHLILIGDHKQLRPKVSYELSVEKGTGYDLNRSLFERLILKGFPLQTLFSQHRMRPEISALVREMTYPELEDAKDTRERADLFGFTDNIIFVNHDEPESELGGTHELGDSKATSSKQNQFEAKMTLKCVRYLSQQGYVTDDIVVLTPYLGQLRLLHDELKVDNDPVLNDLDSYYLVRAGLMPEATAKLNKPRLRISTIDNFQGEEANIVVASLCRSNVEKDIGFMSAPERLNVLVSRARDALIIIGNAEHFMGSRKGGDLWKRFLGLLKAGMHVYDGFPVRCERHPDRKAILRKPADFDTECPDGGCKEPCGKILNCGTHVCPDHCHLLCDHSEMKCRALVSSECDKGHVTSCECHAKDVCSTCELNAQIEAEKAREEAKQKAKALEEKKKHALLMDELDQEIDAIKAEAEAKLSACNAAAEKAEGSAPIKASEGREPSVSDKVGNQLHRNTAARKKQKMQAQARFRQHQGLPPTQQKPKTVKNRVRNKQQLSYAESRAEVEPLRFQAMNFEGTRDTNERHLNSLRMARLYERKQELQELETAQIEDVSVQELNDAEKHYRAKVERIRIQAMKMKRARDIEAKRFNASREVQLQEQRNYETAQAQILNPQQLSEAEESSRAKMERVKIQAMKLKRARVAEESRLNTLREVEFEERKLEQEKRKQEQQAEKKRLFGWGSGRPRRINQSSNYRGAGRTGLPTTWKTWQTENSQGASSHPEKSAKRSENPMWKHRSATSSVNFFD